jgi:arylsulfatase A-like enzyme
VRPFAAIFSQPLVLCGAHANPSQAKQRLIDKYQKKAVALGLDYEQTFAEGDYFPCEHKKDQRIVRRLVQSDPAYAAMVETVDSNIGLLLEALEEHGLRDDTIIVFTSDNGGLATAEGSPTCNAPLSEGKGWVYEGGERVPWFISWPRKISAGLVSDLPIYGPDLYPTLLGLAGLPQQPQQHADGDDLSPALLGYNDRELRVRDLYFHYPHYGNQGGRPSGALRHDTWKLIEDFETGAIHLFDLAADLGETHDLAEKHPDITAEMHARLVAWRLEVQATMPEINPDWSA